MVVAEMQYICKAVSKYIILSRKLWVPWGLGDLTPSEHKIHYTSEFPIPLSPESSNRPLLVREMYEHIWQYHGTHIRLFTGEAKEYSLSDLLSTINTDDVLLSTILLLFQWERMFDGNLWELVQKVYSCSGSKYELMWLWRLFTI